MAALGIIIMCLMVIVFVGAIGRWRELLSIQSTTKDAYGNTVLVEAEE